jgi:hypothetical protein
LGTQVQGQTSVPGYLSNKVTTTGAGNIIQNYLQKLSKDYIRSTRTSKGYRKYPGPRGAIVTRPPRTRRHLGNNSPKTRKKDIKKNNILIIHGKHNCPCVIGYNPYTRRHPPNKHTI